MCEKFKGVLVGILIGVIISATTTFALNGSVQKILEYRDIKICVDGNKITPTDANGNYVEPFIIDGTTYLPVRAVANAFGKEVSWDEETHTVYIGEKPAAKYMEAYKLNIEEVISKYGRFVDKEGMGVHGLKYGTLVDFEKDTVPELVIIHDETVEIYRFDGEKSYKIYEEKTGSRFMQTDVSPTIGINTVSEKPCIITYHSPTEWNSEELRVFTISNGAPKVQVLYAEGNRFNAESGMLEDGFDIFKIDGARVSKETYNTLRESIFNGEKEIDVMWSYDFEMPDRYICANEEELNLFLEKFGL